MRLAGRRTIHSPFRHGRHEQRTGASGQRLRLALLLVSTAVVTVAVPPLLSPQPTSDGSAPSGAASATGSSPPSSSPSSRLTVEAEDEDNELSGGARRVACAACHGGGRVRYIGGSARLTVRVPVDSPGTRTLTVIYEVDGWRTLKIDLNGAALLERELGGEGWEVPRELRFTAVVGAGTVLLTFYNDESPAPDLDAIMIE